MRILLIEDDALIGDGLKVGLKSSDSASTGLRTAPREKRPCFRLRMPRSSSIWACRKKDGLAILQDWRHKNRKEPVLILTARGDVDQRIAGLNSGADDYLGKPFCPERGAGAAECAYPPQRRAGGSGYPARKNRI